MRSIITLFLCFPFLVSLSQNWDYFPKDSLRCYTVDDYGRLMGIDFRDHSKSAGNDIIHLDSFGNFIPIDTAIREVDAFQFYFRNKNSHYGNRIVKSQNYTLVQITDDFDRSIVNKTIKLEHSNHLGHQWTFYQDDSIKITARVAELGTEKINGRLDSVKTIHLWGFNKSNLNDSFLHIMRVGKSFGIYSTPRLYGFVNHKFTEFYTVIDHLMNYSPSKFKYMDKLVEGDIHYSFEQANSDTKEYLRIRKSKDGQNIKSTYDGYMITFNGFDGTTLLLDTSYTQDEDDFEWYNLDFRFFDLPQNFIPGRVYEIKSNDDIFDPNIRLRCDSSYQFNLAGKGRQSLRSIRLGAQLLYRHNSDIFYTAYLEGETQFLDWYWASYAEDVGLLSAGGTSSYGYRAHWSFGLDYHPLEHCLEQNPIVFASSRSLKLQKLNFYPNPASGTITLNRTLNKPSEFQIFNVHGAEVIDGITLGNIDVSNISTGIYYLNLLIEGEQHSSKLVIAR